MSRIPILGLPRDLVCAAALGIVDLPRVAASPETVSVHDEQMQLLGMLRDWLTGDDALDVVTREYLTAKRDAAQAASRPGQPAWEAVAKNKKRADANARLVQARTQGRRLLAERGTLAEAKKRGLRVFDQS